MFAVLIRDLGVDLGSFGIITRRDHRLSPGAQLMLNSLRETAAALCDMSGQARSFLLSLDDPDEFRH